jgi:type IX secretion system PorP/SprF family membrane protein
MKNICKYIVISLVLLTFFGEKVNAQDPHFSQFYNAPMQLNPALAGLLRGNFRAVANYRSQWSSISTPFRTMSASADFNIMNSLTKKDLFGIGIFVLNDVAGEAKLKNTQVGISFAYNKDMTGKGNHFIGIGAQYLFVQQSLDFTKLLFESQFNGEYIDPMMNSGEDLAMGNLNYLDFNAGISWAYRPSKYRSFYAGGSLSHLNQPGVSFFDGVSERLRMRYTFYGGAEFKVNRNISFIPRAVVLLQGLAKEVNVGGLVKFNVGDNRGANDKTSIYFGTMHRWKDAQVIIMRYDYGNIGFSFSYDVNISALNISSKGRGAVELAIIYSNDVFDNQRRTKIQCPKF